MESSEDDLLITYTNTSHRYKINQDGIIEQIADLTPEESQKIVDMKTFGYGGVYFVQADGTVKYMDLEYSTLLTELNTQTATTITENGVRYADDLDMIDNSGKVYTIGYNNYGELGNGSKQESLTPICISDIVNHPLNGINIVEIKGNNNNKIARDNNGKVYTWGKNDCGQLGNGSTTNSNIPICLSDISANALNGVNIVKIENKINSMIAIDNNGKVYTWGKNDCGQLGNGSTINSNVPVCISKPGTALDGVNIVEIVEVENNNTIIVKDNNGRIYTWGKNDCGQLGSGSFNNSNVPVCISKPGTELNEVNISYIKGYFDSVIAIDTNGKVYTWGNNSDGLIGNGSTINSNTPVCLSNISGNALNGANIVYIENIYNRIIIAKDTNGRIYTWGENDYGQLGNKTTNNSNTPICVNSVSQSELNEVKIANIAKIQSGAFIIVTDTSGKVYTWGYNECGELGNGSTINSSAPICISKPGTPLNGVNIVEVKEYFDTVVARDNNGKVYVWGNNNFGLSNVEDPKIPTCLNNIESSNLYNKKVVKSINYSGLNIYLTEDGSVVYNKINTAY